MTYDANQYSHVSYRRTFSDMIAIISETRHSNDILLAAVFEELETIFPWQAMSLSVYDPTTRRHKSIISSGYDKDTVNYLDNSYIHVDPAYSWIVRTAQPFFSWKTTHFDYSESVSARNYWIPGGYRGGSTSHLTSRDNRYVGNFHTSTDSPDHPSVEVLQLIDDISPALAKLMDVWRDPVQLLHDIRPIDFSLFVDAKNNIHSIPGYPHCGTKELHDLIRKSILRGASHDGVRTLNTHLPSACWYRLNGEIIKIQFKPCNQGWVIIYGLWEFPHGLTVRQAEICSLLSIGLTNFQIAEILSISPRTVERHLEILFCKFELHNRVELVYHAIINGLVNIGDFLTHMRGGVFQCKQ